LVAAAFFLAGCRADVTFRFDLHTDGSALATTHEVFDDQLFKLARSQDATSDPFGTERLENAGWTVARTVDGAGNHIITMSKLLGRGDLNLSQGTAAEFRRSIPPLSSLELSRSPSLFTERDSVTATIPALLPLAQANIHRPDVGLASAIADSIAAVHLELRTPGKVLATNGETTPSGFVRWDLGLEAPTTVYYTVQIVRWDRIAVLIAISLIALVLALWQLCMRSRLLIRARRR
jgi:hypothetical protein